MSRRVLVVDDSLTVRMDIAEALTSAGFTPVLCATAAEARAALDAQPVDAIVLDVLLPDADGVTLLQELRAMPAAAGAPILMLSSEADVKDRIRGLTTGADEYVGKPYDAGYLVSRLEELLRANGRADSATILIIDDSLTFRRAFRETLEAAGYVVLEASSGEEGLRLAGMRHPDALVVDGVLPGMDGATVIRHLRLDAALRDVPCLLLTGSDEAQNELMALDSGADAFIRKGEDSAIVLARLAAMLRRAPRRPRAEDQTRSLRGLKKVLVIGASAPHLGAVSEALREEGYDVIRAQAGEEALELLAVQAVDGILLDRSLPGRSGADPSDAGPIAVALSGREICERIKAAPTLRDIPLIVLTAPDDRDAVIEALTAGADDCLPHAGELAVLKARLRAQIRRKQFEDENRRIGEQLLRRELEAAEARAARELAETKAALVDELARKNQELEAFSYSVSHDLRAPLRAIDGFSRIVLERFGETLDPSGQDYLKRVCAAAHRMAELIDDLLALSRVGRADLRRARVNLSQIAQDVVAGLRRRADRPIDVSIEDGLVADADPRLLQIVFENLLGNAWKFTAHTPDARIAVGRQLDGERAAYYVRDNGAGFDMAYAAKLFRPFQRLHSESEFEGTGIGLATIHRIVDRHGGRVWAEGAVGRGATFFFTLPRGRQSGQS